MIESTVYGGGDAEQMKQVVPEQYANMDEQINIELAGIIRRMFPQDHSRQITHQEDSELVSDLHQLLAHRSSQNERSNSYLFWLNLKREVHRLSGVKSNNGEDENLMAHVLSVVKQAGLDKDDIARFEAQIVEKLYGMETTVLRERQSLRQLEQVFSKVGIENKHAVKDYLFLWLIDHPSTQRDTRLNDLKFFCEKTETELEEAKATIKSLLFSRIREYGFGILDTMGDAFTQLFDVTTSYGITLTNEEIFELVVMSKDKLPGLKKLDEPTFIGRVLERVTKGRTRLEAKSLPVSQVFNDFKAFLESKLSSAA